LERTTTPPDEFLASLPDDVRDDMVALDAALTPVFAGHERVLWEGVFYGGTQQRIVGYGTYHYRARSGAEGDWFVAGIARQKDHITFYVSGTEDGQSLIKRYGAGLGKVKVGSGSVTFRRLADVDLTAIVELARRARDRMVEST
jgi:hypothetical protein